MLDLKNMNIALLLKWWWKFHDPTYSKTWKTLIQYIYLQHHSICGYVPPLWKIIQKLHNLGSCSDQYSPGQQSTIRLWKDIWFENYPLSFRYPQVFNYCSNPDILLIEVINTQGAGVEFSDTLTGISLFEWNELLHTLSKISFTHDMDKLSWRWDSTGSFSVKSIYQILNYTGILTRQPLLWWSIPIPPKIRIFMWLTFRNRILTKHNLRKKRMGRE